MTPQQLAAAITADDRLLDRLGSATPGTQHDDLGTLLLDWRHEIDSVNPGDLVDTDTAAAVITHATRPTWNAYGLIRAAVLALLVIAALLAAFAAIKAGAA